MAARQSGSTTPVSEEPVNTGSTTPVNSDTEVKTAEAPKEKTGKGWLRHIASDSFHEVDDVKAARDAYPGQFEDVDGPANKDKIGWPEPPKEGDDAAE